MKKIEALQKTNFEMVDGLNAIMWPQIQGASHYVDSPKLFDEWFSRFMEKEKPIFIGLNFHLKYAGQKEITTNEVKAYFRAVAESIKKAKSKPKSE